MSFYKYYFLAERKYYVDALQFASFIAKAFCRHYKRLQQTQANVAKDGEVEIAYDKVQQIFTIKYKSITISVAFRYNEGYAVGDFVSSSKTHQGYKAAIVVYPDNVKRKAVKTKALESVVMQDVMVHELTHAFENIKYNFYDIGNKVFSKQYLHRPHERNAFIVQYLNQVANTPQAQDIIDSDAPTSQKAKLIAKMVFAKIDFDNFEQQVSKPQQRKWLSEIYKAAQAFIELS